MLENLSPRETVEYFCSKPWGGKYEDDKYFDSELLEDNFIVFYTYAFAWLGLPRPSRAQYEMALFISDKSNPHRLLMAMRGLSKSLTSQIYVVWRLLLNPEEKILVMSAGRTRAGNYSQFVQKLIKMLPITKNMAPRHNLERTSGESFDVAGSTPSDSPSVYAVGAKTQVTGFRASIIVYDDIETAQTVESSVMTEAINNYAMEAQNLLMDNRDESITLCTPHSMSSIYIDWIDNRGFVPFIIPAEYPSNESVYFGGLAQYIKDNLKANPNLVGRAVDERLNDAFLQSRKSRIGKSKYKLQYLLDVSESDALRYPLKLSDFIVDDIDDDIAPLKYSYSSMPENHLYIKHNGFAKDKFFKPSYRSNETASYDYRIMFVDTAGTGKDEVGITILYHLNTRLFIKKCTGLSGGFDDETLNSIAVMCDIHRVETLVVEDNFGDGTFRKLLEPHMARKSPRTEMVGHKVKGQKEVRIIESLEPLLNQHKLVIDKELLEHDNKVEPKHYSLTNQLSHITRERDSLKHDDRLDSLSGAVIYMLEFMTNDEDRGFDYHLEKEAEKTLEFTLKYFSGRSRKKNFRNYANNF